ncbi:MAG TPA: serine hydrolase domain-containing protein [Thermomicrobiales bacterium]|nr:serine hydrolase domain-containing protein [Thermomicrobiales bacterium]
MSESLDAVVAEQMRRWTVPGVTVGVLKDGKRNLHAWGVTSLETEQPVREDTLFQIGSISKVFCATLVMTLVDEGKVDLDAPILTYLPDLRLADEAAQSDITLRHTLTHTSGIYGDFFDDFGMGDDALARSVEGFATLRQWTPLGSSWAYCNVGFNLAGAVVEKVLGQGYEQAMRERVFEPAGLGHSFFFAHEAIVHSAAIGHTLVDPAGDEHQVASKYPLPRCVNPAGGIISTVDDLLGFAAMHMNGGTVGDRQMLSAASAAAMQEKQTSAANWADEWGIGWDIRWVGGEKLIGHGGSTNGFQARLTAVPNRGYAIAILTNSGRGAALNNAVERWALSNDLGIDLPNPERVTLSSEQLAAVAGSYRQPQAEYTVSVEDGGLRLEVVGISPLSGQRITPPAERLEPVGEREFLVTTGAGAGRRVDFFGGDGDHPRFIRNGGRLAERD